MRNSRMKQTATLKDIAEKGYSSFLINTNEDEKSEFQAVQSAINKNIDCIIICPSQKFTKKIRDLSKDEVRYV